MYVCDIDCQIKELRILPCSFGLTGRVHEEECDESFSVFCLVTKNCAHFLIEKRNGKKGDDKKRNSNFGEGFEKR